MFDGLGMLRAGRHRAVPLVGADALAPPFVDGAFDAVTISFGLRNVADPDAALAELARVTRPGGIMMLHRGGKFMLGDEGFPEVVVVPAYPTVVGERKDLRFELRRAESGDAVGIAFTTVEKLIEQLGRFQPWIVMRSDRVCQLLAAAAVTTIVLDGLFDDLMKDAG